MTPAESDFLLRLAALSLAFVGFSAIVVTLRGALGGKLADRHLRLVRLYIEGGFVVTALSLVPSLLNLLRVPEMILWSVSSAAAALVFTYVLVTQYRRRRTIENEFPPWVVVVFVVSSAAVIGLWLNVGGIFFRPGIGPYAVTLTWALCVFGFVFLRTIEVFLHREPPA